MSLPYINTGMPAAYMNPYQQMLMQNMQQLYGQMIPQQQQQAQQPTTTLPMIHCDMIEAENEEWARQFNVSPGNTQTFYTRDNQFIFVKTALQNGGFEFDVYEKQAPKPEKEYMTREQVMQMIREARGGERTKDHGA